MSTDPGARRPLVISGRLFRTKGKRVRFGAVEEPVPEPPPVVRRPAKVAQLLALAHHIQRAIDAGLVADRAEVARRLGFTRARVSQLLDLCLLAPDIQAELLELEAVDGVEPVSERGLRELVRVGCWAEQRRNFRPVLLGRQPRLSCEGCNSHRHFIDAGTQKPS
jgi:hypothetical protein